MVVLITVVSDEAACRYASTYRARCQHPDNLRGGNFRLTSSLSIISSSKGIADIACQQAVGNRSEVAILGLEEPSVLGVYSEPATGSGRRGSSGTPLLTRGRASPASPVRPSETFAPVKFASLAAGVPSPTTFVSPDSKSVAGPLHQINLRD